MIAMTGHLEKLAAWVWECSWQAGVLALVILAVQFVLGSRLSAVWRCRLWLLVLVRLLLPELPAAHTSVYNWAPSRLELVAPGSFEPSASPSVSLAEAPVETAAPPSLRPSAASVLAVMWLLGVVGLAVTGLCSYGVFWRKVRQGNVPPGAGLAELFAEAKAGAGVRRARLLVTNGVETPGVSGLFRPAVLLPARIEECLDDDDIRRVLQHELAHIRRLDLGTNWLFWLLGVVHWFNPVLYLALRRMRADRELACDENVMTATNDAAGYGETLLRVWERGRPESHLLGFVGIFERCADQKRRMRHIAGFRKPSAAAALAGLAAMAMIALFTLTGEMPAAPKDKALATSYVETEVQMISLRNDRSAVFFEQAPRLRGVALQMEIRRLVEKGQAEVFSVDKLSSESGTHTYSQGLMRVDVEPVLGPGAVDLTLMIKREADKTQMALSELLPLDEPIFVGSFDDPRPEKDATILVITTCKIVTL